MPPPSKRFPRMNPRVCRTFISTLHSNGSENRGLTGNAWYYFGSRVSAVVSCWEYYPSCTALKVHFVHRIQEDTIVGSLLMAYYIFRSSNNRNPRGRIRHWKECWNWPSNSHSVHQPNTETILQFSKICFPFCLFGIEVSRLRVLL